MHPSRFTPHGLVIRGFEGVQGQTGKRGIVGPEGIPGNPHPNPIPGIIGLLGCPGPRGEPGSQGRVGPLGPPGVDGDIGPPGPQGLIGSRGPRGKDGPFGPPGIQGNIGQKGPRGLDGPQGPDGSPGDSWWYPQPIKFGCETKESIMSTNLTSCVSALTSMITAANTSTIDSKFDPTLSASIDSKFDPKFETDSYNLVQDNNNQLWYYSDTICQWRLVAESRPYDGPIGVQGVNGVPGTDGAIGETGAVGERGIQGPVGPDITVFNTLYVDMVYGDDDTAVSGRPASPFATCRAAMEQASETDIILVLNGHHKTYNLDKQNITWSLSPGVIIENIGKSPLFVGRYSNVLGQGQLISRDHAVFDVAEGSYIRVECHIISTFDCPAICISSGGRAKVQVNEIITQGLSASVINQGMLYLDAFAVENDTDSCLVLLEGYSVVNVNKCITTGSHKSTVGIYGGTNFLSIINLHGVQPLVLGSTVYNLWTKCVISNLSISDGQNPNGVNVQRLGESNIDACIEIDSIDSQVPEACGYQQSGGLVHLQCNRMSLSGSNSTGIKLDGGVLSLCIDTCIVSGTLGILQQESALTMKAQSMIGSKGWMITNTLSSQLDIQTLSVDAGQCGIIVDRLNEENPLHLHVQCLGGEESIALDHRRGYVLSTIESLRGGCIQSGGRSSLHVGQYFTQKKDNRCLTLLDGECRMRVSIVQNKSVGSCFEIQGGRLWIECQQCVSQGSVAHVSQYQNSHWIMTSIHSQEGWIIDNGHTNIDVNDMECEGPCWSIVKGNVDICATRVVSTLDTTLSIQGEAVVSLKAMQAIGQQSAVTNDSELSTLYLQGDFKSLINETISLRTVPKKLTLMQCILYTAQGASTIGCDSECIVHNLCSLVVNKLPTDKVIMGLDNLQLIK